MLFNGVTVFSCLQLVKKKKQIAGLFYERYFSVEAFRDTNSKLNKMKRPGTKQLFAGFGILCGL